jgi:hypothetical protein
MNIFKNHHLNPANYPSPHCDTHGAASYLGFGSSTMRVSRVTGTLAGVPAPTYRKIGRKVIYDRMILDEWIDQFANQQKTATREVL